MKIKLYIIIGLLTLGVSFLLLDRCGSSRKLDNLKGQYEEASRIAKVEKQIKEETIKKQNKIIERQDLLIAEANKEVEIKNSHILRLGNTIADLEDEFGSLTDKDEKIANLVSQVSIWKEKFTLAQSIIADKDEIIFSLTEKYNAQLIISNSYKSLYETLQVNERSLQKIVTAQDWQIKKLKLASGLKSGIVIIIAGYLIYDMVK